MRVTFRKVVEEIRSVELIADAPVEEIQQTLDVAGTLISDNRAGEAITLLRASGLVHLFEVLAEYPACPIVSTT